MRARSVLALLAVAVLVSGCGGSSSSSSLAEPAGTLGTAADRNVDNGSGGVLGLGSDQSPDPVIQDFPVAFIRRPVRDAEDGMLLTRSLRAPLRFSAGASLWFKTSAAASATERNLTPALVAALQGLAPPDGAPDESQREIDLRALAPSFDGDEFAFTVRLAPTETEPEPTWNIWRYIVADEEFVPVFPSSVIAEAGNDVDPTYLPDGRLVFSSDRHRRTRAILLDEGKPQYAPLDDARDRPALVLHRVERDGSALTQLSFNRSDDLQPAILDDGRVVFLRWNNARGQGPFSLHTMSPDGRGVAPLYGFHSHDTGTNEAEVEFIAPRAMADGRLVSLLSPACDSARFGGQPVAIDVGAYVEHDVPTAAAASLLADAQEALVAGDITTDGGLSPAGRYRSVFPVLDGSGRLLVSWSQCRLASVDDADPTAIRPCAAATEEELAELPEEADPLYGLWLFDPSSQTQQPVVVPQPDEAVEEGIVISPRGLAAIVADPVAGVDIEADLVTANAGVLLLDSVFDVDGADRTDAGVRALSDPTQFAPDASPERFLRIVQPVALPPDEVLDLPNTAFGRSQAEQMRSILGYAPIEPDGSVAVQVPADVAFTISLVDRAGRRVSGRHQHWLQVRPGEVLVCRGCHEPDSEAPHGRVDAQPASINPGAPFANVNPQIGSLSLEPGTTMAAARNLAAAIADDTGATPGVAAPGFDLIYEDVWTDPARGPLAASFALRWQDLTTPAPVSGSCQTQWQSGCRSTIHYPTHLQPLWDQSRPEFDVDGITVLADRRCVGCHGPEDALGVAQVPASQLDLSATASLDQADHLTSYRELLFGDVEQEVVDGVLLDRLVQAVDGAGVPQFEVDEEGELVLDDDGLPVPVLVTVPVGNVGSVNGALASEDFFAPFASGATHEGWLSAAELRLVSEWLDLGAQYYNDPFVVPPQ